MFIIIINVTILYYNRQYNITWRHSICHQEYQGPGEDLHCEWEIILLSLEFIPSVYKSGGRGLQSIFDREIEKCNVYV